MDMSELKKVTQAIILAAGRGTRLKPLTIENPKVLLPVGEKPLLEYTVAWLKKYRITNMAINLYHLGHQIKQFLGDGSRFGVSVTYSQEEFLLGTAGAVKRLENFIEGRFITVCGDILTNLNLDDMIDFHLRNRALVTIAIKRVNNPRGFGIVELDVNNRITSFTEKPQEVTEKSNLGSGGIYLFEREILNNISLKTPLDFGYDVFPVLLKKGISMYGYLPKQDTYIIDVGNIDQYHKVNNDIKEGRVKFD